jgi:hypothetical protein
MINHNMKVGQRVMFSDAVVRRCGHDKTVADMRGVIIFSERTNKYIACVDTEGTLPNEEGNSIRYIPIKNLVVVNK